MLNDSGDGQAWIKVCCPLQTSLGTSQHGQVKMMNNLPWSWVARHGLGIYRNRGTGAMYVVIMYVCMYVCICICNVCVYVCMYMHL